MRKTKKVIFIIISVLLVAFLVLNIVWFSFYFSMKKKLAGALEIMEKDEEHDEHDDVFFETYSSKDHGNTKYDENYVNNYKYYINMPKYLVFSCSINVAGGYNLEDEDGVMKYTEDYGVVSIFTFKPFGKYRYQLDIVCCNDENGEARKEILNVPVFIDKNRVPLSAEEVERIDDGAVMVFYEHIGITLSEAEELYNNEAAEYVNSMCDCMEKYYGDWIFND